MSRELSNRHKNDGMNPRIPKDSQGLTKESIYELPPGGMLW